MPSEDTLAINDPSFSTCHGALVSGKLSSRATDQEGTVGWICGVVSEVKTARLDHLKTWDQGSIRLATKCFLCEFGQPNVFLFQWEEFSFGGLDVYKLVEGSRSLCCSANQSILLQTISPSMWTRRASATCPQIVEARPHLQLAIAGGLCRL